MRIIGLDVDRSFAVAVFLDGGKMLHGGRVELTRDAVIAFGQQLRRDDEVVIEASALFGGIDIQVPENWNVVVEGHGIFGGYDDKTFHTAPEDASPRVVIAGNAVFGGVVIKN